jgi:hypothetical protein
MSDEARAAPARRPSAIDPAPPATMRAASTLTDAGTDLRRRTRSRRTTAPWCHKQGKDGAREGPARESRPTAQGGVQAPRFGVTLAGCPLEERISEFPR